MLKKLKQRIKRKLVQSDTIVRIYTYLYDLKWYILKEIKLISWTPNKRYVEIEITTKCNLACPNCNRSARQATSNECMSIKQIKKFVHESIELKWNWKRIDLIGGEPTLHPRLFEILKILKPYKSHNPECHIQLSTNGCGNKVNEILSRLPRWISIRNSKKSSGLNMFHTYNIAPVDLKEYKDKNFTRGCWITKKCGLGLTRYGYYPCGPGASVDRVFGFNIGQKKLSSVNSLTLKKQLRQLCRYCGHYRGNYNTEKTSKEKMSITWKKAYEKYKRKKPNLSLY